MNQRIKELRKSLKLTQSNFARKIGIGATAISKLEKGENTPSDQTILSICREFNVNEQWLRTGEGEMFDTKPTSELKLQLLHLIDKLPENKLSYVLSYAQGLYAAEQMPKRG